MNEATTPITTMCAPTAMQNEVMKLATPSEGCSSEIEQIQSFLSSNYLFKHNKVTNRLLVRRLAD